MRQFVKVAVAPLASLLVLLITTLSLAFFAVDRDTLAEMNLPVAEPESTPPPFSPTAVTDDVLWLARCIYSETKRPEEQELVAWVVRNRVETEYRGVGTYEGVVLDPYQFSAFNPNSTKRTMYTGLTPVSQARGWRRAMEVAYEVYHAPVDARPFSPKTRHFYSEQSMVGGRQPGWAQGHAPVRVTRVPIDPRRFRFYSGVA